MKEALGSGGHRPVAHDCCLQRGWSVETVGRGELSRVKVWRRQIIAVIETHGASTFGIGHVVIESEESFGMNKSIEQQRPVGRIKTVHVAPGLLPGGRVVEDTSGGDMKVADKRSVVCRIDERCLKVVRVAACSLSHAIVIQFPEVRIE